MMAFIAIFSSIISQAQLQNGKQMMVKNFTKDVYEKMKALSYPASVMIPLNGGQLLIQHPGLEDVVISYFIGGHEKFNVSIKKNKPIMEMGNKFGSITDQYIDTILFAGFAYIAANYVAPADEGSKSFYFPADNAKRQRLDSLRRKDGKMNTITINSTEKLVFEPQYDYYSDSVVIRPRSYPEVYYYKNNVQLFEFRAHPNWEENRIEFLILNKGNISYTDATAFIKSWAGKI